MKKTLLFTAALSALTALACDGLAELQQADITDETVELNIAGSCDSLTIEATAGASLVEASGSDTAIVSGDGDTINVVVADGDVVIKTSPDLELKLVMDGGDLTITGYEASADIAAKDATVDVAIALDGEESLKIAGDVQNTTLDITFADDASATIAGKGDATLKLDSDAGFTMDIAAGAVTMDDAFSTDIPPVEGVFTGDVNGGGSEIEIAVDGDVTIEPR